MASTKREDEETQYEEQPQLKRLKYQSDDDDNKPSISNRNRQVSLNPADCDLAFNIEADGLTGHALYQDGFAYCWSGARGTVGINDGKYYFGCRIIASQTVKMDDTPLDQQNVTRVGISPKDDPVGNLGETEHSYGFGGTGKFSNAGRFVNYDEQFGIGDTIICLVDLRSRSKPDGSNGSIEFCKNGRCLGVAKRFTVTGSSELEFFPHVLLKNTVVKMQFSVEDGLIPIDGYKPWGYAVKDEKATVGPSLADPTECEVIMMVGLPAAGKSTWAEKWVKEHPEKRYVLLGTNLALDQMKVPGLWRKHNYGERFDKLMDRATGIFNTLLSRASNVPRNYIIDQTNVYKSARRRKLKPFASYHKIAVVVFPRADELKLRAKKRFKEMGKDVPPEAINEMLANFVLPISKDMHRADEFFDKVIFTDLNRSEAQQQLNEMKRALTSSSSFSVKPTSVRPSPTFSQETYSSFRSYSVPSVRAEVPAGYSWAGRPELVAPTYTSNVGFPRSLNPIGFRSNPETFGSYGYYPNPHSERQYDPNYSEHRNPRAYGSYHPGPRDIDYRPPRYYY